MSDAVAIHGASEVMVRTVPISSIKVGARHRKDMGDIKGLAASIEFVGLLQPIPPREAPQSVTHVPRLFRTLSP